MDRPAFDLQRALDMVEGDGDLLVATAQRFLEQNATRLDQLHDAVARRDAAAVERLAHGLAGAALNFGADDTERSARALVECAVAGDSPAFRSLLERLEAVLSDLSEALSAYCTRHELRNVLVADDDDLTRMRLEQLLTKWGHRVTSVSRGDVALEMLSPSGPPYLAIIDWMMPGLDGTDVCRALRARKSETYTYVILITARNDADAVVTAMEAGADDFLTKPVVPEELRVRLRAGQRIVELQERLIASRDEHRRRADRDGLTGALSRRRGFEILEAALVQSAAAGEELSVARADLDGFKRINEVHGHDVADRTLRAASLRMQRLLRRTDSFGRCGGDEFLIVLPHTRRREALVIAQRICEAVADGPLDCGEVALPLTTSIGVASTGAGASDAEALVKAADRALFQAKAGGGNRALADDSDELETGA